MIMSVNNTNNNNMMKLIKIMISVMLIMSIITKVNQIILLKNVFSSLIVELYNINFFQCKGPINDNTFWQLFCFLEKMFKFQEVSP